MDAADRALLRAWQLAAAEDFDAVEKELNALVPILIKAGYAEERPWGDDPDWVLWSFSRKGVERVERLDDPD